MRRIFPLPFVLIPILMMDGIAAAGPLPLDSSQRAPASPFAAIFSASPESPQAARPAAAVRGAWGGGFFEFLFRGPRAAGYSYPSYQRAGDLGPGMIEAPGYPGQAVIDPRYLKQEVGYDGSEPPGTVIIETRERFLYLVLVGRRALRYGIGVGRPGFTWSGVHRVSQKREWPDWMPPDEMLKRRPDLPRHMAGGADNPLGARAMYLGSTLYRIHGSNEPWTIGTQVSSGCIRMRNEDVIDLYDRVRVGAKVVVI
ncbi:MAG TPA: L,D-transpeptidase [Xanthobacteraceae bacterium]